MTVIRRLASLLAILPLLFVQACAPAVPPAAVSEVRGAAETSVYRDLFRE